MASSRLPLPMIFPEGQAVEAGTLSLQGNGSIGEDDGATRLNVNGVSTLEYGDGIRNSLPIFLRARLNMNVSDGAAATQSGDFSYDIRETDPITFTKTGAGQLTLSGSQGYIGLTTISEGTLLADNFTGSVLNTGGTFSPGQSPATTSIGGGYTQQAGGTVLLEIGGTTAGTDYDVLTLGANSDLAGTIAVQLINGFTPSFGDQFTLITSTATITDSGVSYNLPALSAGLEWTTTMSTTSLVLEIGYSNDLDGFRAQYGLNPDGSEDALDWSGNGIANILYLAFGLGDPNESDFDRTRLPSIENESTFGDYALSFVQPKTNVGLDIDLTTTEDLTSSFVDIDSLGSAYQPVQTDPESLDADYERITEHFDFVGEEEIRFYRIEVDETE
ncbi:MAG: autotransporter-associated beta strand repeat-containing protein [Verrucomicrobiota bacterium]